MTARAYFVVLVRGVIFRMVARYEHALERLNAELAAANDALCRLEATRDEKLLDLARDLSLSLADLIGHAQIALQSTTDLPNIKTFSRAVDDAQSLRAIAHELLELKHMADAVPAARHPAAAGE